MGAVSDANAGYPELTQAHVNEAFIVDIETTESYSETGDGSQC
jgi:hypothetical protein